mmetsp:Transcript_29896/g.50012  ORF Transcript_29896/g.50012 Transcript_29896/m.50012 type:complete len:450 (+) Transcript_29896:240-1589(+)
MDYTADDQKNIYGRDPTGTSAADFGDASSQAYHLQNNGYNLGGGFGGQQSALQLAQQRQQQMSLSRGQNENSILNIGGNMNSLYQLSQSQQRGVGLNDVQLDSSNFPSLGSTVNNSGSNSSRGVNSIVGQSSQHQGTLGSYGNAVFSGSGGLTGNDFTIENEDFPALPGSSSSSTINKGNLDPSVSSNNNNSSLGGGRDLGSVGQQSSNSQQQQQQQQQSALPAFGGGAFDSSISPVGGGLLVGNGLTNQSAQSSQQHLPQQTIAVSMDVKFGLMGLLEIIKLPDQDMNALALGTDLTAFGLNLNAADSLFPTFSSPFTDKALTPEPQFQTPSCYMMHPPSLKSEHLSKFQIETLFYMFYSMPRDILQACAAQELYRRDWRFHRDLKIWLKPRTQHELMQSHPSVMFSFFDCQSWETRLFTDARGPSVVASLLSEEEVRVKVPPPAPAP